MKLFILKNISFNLIKMERKSRVLTNITLILITIQIILATEIQGQRSGSQNI